MRLENLIKIEEGYPENYPELLLNDSEIKVLKGQKLGLAKTKEVIVEFQDGTHEIGRRFRCPGDDYFWWGNIEVSEPNSPRKIIGWRSLNSN